MYYFKMHFEVKVLYKAQIKTLNLLSFIFYTLGKFSSDLFLHVLSNFQETNSPNCYKSLFWLLSSKQLTFLGTKRSVCAKAMLEPTNETTFDLLLLELVNCFSQAWC